jgi:dihydroneopterin aldolase
VSDVITLRELRCSAIVGVLSEERDRAQPIAFDIDLERSLQEAAISDDLEQTTNYAAVLSRVVEVATEGRFLLLETLAYRVAYAVLDIDRAIDAVTIEVRKLRPPVPEDIATVGVRCRVVRPS